MKASANFAFANRQLILHQVRKAFKKVFGKEIKLKQVYDVAHNIVKIEEYEGKKLIVHRKGATRAFWKGHPELAPKYREIGQPTLIPGSMGTSSYILIGQELAKEISFGSAPHGAGRLMSRAEAKRKVREVSLKKNLKKEEFLWLLEVCQVLLKKHQLLIKMFLKLLKLFIILALLKN
jgi:tRNA-splicing ligase RtcB